MEVSSMSNISYFFSFNIRIFKAHLVTNILSFLAIIFSITMLLGVYDTKLYIVEIVKILEAESNLDVFIKDNEFQYSQNYLINLDGVKNVEFISKEEAKDKIISILGDEGDIINDFDTNPFVDYLQIEVSKENIDSVINEVNKMANIEYIRDNKDVLQKMILFSRNVKTTVFFILLVVLIGTIVTVFHLVRQAMESMSDRIGTLRLLGAPEYFIMIPFYIYSFLMTIMGALLSLILSGYFLKGILKMYTSFPFMPHIDVKTVLLSNSILVLGLSILLGVGGTFIGIKTSKIQ
jgi:cell division transport system permease protein